MRPSLRLRLFLMSVLVVGSAVGTLALLSSRVTSLEIQRLVTVEGREERFHDVVEQEVEVSQSSVQRRLLLAALVAAGVGLLVTALLSRRILGPVEQLTAAARKMAGGDLSGRVAVVSGDEIGQLAQAFNGMADSLERIEALRKNLVSDVAHELRTPLTNMRCQLEAVQDGLAAAGPGVIDSLHEETMLLQRLVEDLQELTLAEAGRLRLDCRPLELRPELERALAELRTGLQVSVSASGSLPPVLADRERLRQILRNLLENAVRHTPDGGRIEVEARPAGAFAEIVVRDTGEGIAAEHLPYVFERFYRADPARDRAKGGSGLGLAIVQQLVRAHGGEIAVESLPGRGSSFRFTLPFISSSQSSTTSLGK